MRYEMLATLGDWTFYRLTDHGFTGELKDRPLFGFSLAVPDGTAAGKPDLGELYASLEHAMVAAVGEKYTGPRGAGGSGVGTAADWFMRMIGADQLQAAGRDGTRALAAALTSDAENPNGAARRIEGALSERGIVLARSAPEPYRA